MRVSHVIDNTHFRNELCPGLTKDVKYSQNCWEYNHQCLYRRTALSNIIYIDKIIPIQYVDISTVMVYFLDVL